MIMYVKEKSDTKMYSSIDAFNKIKPYTTKMNPVVKVLLQDFNEDGYDDYFKAVVEFPSIADEVNSVDLIFFLSYKLDTIVKMEV